MESIFEFLTAIMTATVIFILLAFLIIAIGYPALTGIDYILDKSNCIVFVEQKQIYAGRCHYVDVNSIGENGNTKKLTIYKDIFCLKPMKHYINNDIQVKEW